MGNNADVVKNGQALVDAHASGDLVVLPTVWDSWSAGLAAEAGFTGLTVGSHPVATARGFEDGETQDLAGYLAVVERIVVSTGLPTSVDVESGYGLPAEELVQRVIAAGGVGVNIEDTLHGEGGRVRSITEQADYIAAAVAAAAAAGVPFVVNGRTDAMVHGTDLFADPVAEAERRSVAMAQAGALSVYPVKLPDAESLSRLVAAVSVPVNATAHPQNGTPAGGLRELQDLGVRRVSFGPLWQMALTPGAAEMLEVWRP